MGKKVERDKKPRKRILDCFWKQCVFCVTCVVLTWIIGDFVEAHIIEMKDKKNIVDDDFSVAFQIDEVRLEEKNIIIDGWAFKLDADATKDDMRIMLYDVDDDRIIYPELKCVSRKDVNKYFACDFDYTDSGFEASFEKKKLDIQEKCYEILFADDVNGNVYRSNTFVVNGNIIYHSPDVVFSLDVAGTELERIVNEGVLRVYEPENHIYVYQYDGKLYWIAEEEHKFINDDTYIYYRMSTTQIDRLSENQLKNGALWEKLDFNFSSNEIVSSDMGKYRVSVCELPKDFSLVKIWTGEYDKDWVWLSFFRPIYEF